jgi:hypothetical protein
MSNVKFKPKLTEKGTELPLLNLKGKPYLQVAHRLVWFREMFPTGIIKTELKEHANEYALVKAEIYIPTGNGQTQLVATAYKAESKASFGDYIEKAETGAIGRALAMAGFGTQFEPEFDEGMRLADSPVDIATKAEETTDVKSAETTVTSTAKPEESKLARPSFRRKIAESKGNVNGASDDL